MHIEDYKNLVLSGNKVEKVGKVRVESECKEWQKMEAKVETEKLRGY